MRFKKNPESGDPSNRQQSFEKMELHVHCCRYWWIKTWRHQRLSYPYWRLYWNKLPGAYVYYKTKVTLDPGHILLIPPHTAFSTDIDSDDNTSMNEFCMEGGWILNPAMEKESMEKGYSPHFFVHFNLGYSFDNVEPSIFQFPADADSLESIDRITGFLMEGKRDFGFEESLDIYNLIISTTRRIPANAWGGVNIDPGILEIMNYIHRHLNEQISNEKLASQANMAPNSFARLFKLQTGLTPQTYIRKMRIDSACRLLHHSGSSINRIAEECGFSDRYYFTKVFTSITNVSPAKYRKGLYMTGGR